MALNIAAGIPSRASITVSRGAEARPAVWVRIDPVRDRGEPAKTPEAIARAARQARSGGLPLVVVLDQGDTDPRTVPDLPLLDGWGRAASEVAACSGQVPVVMGVTGPMLAAASLLLGLADHVVMTDSARAFVSGPETIRTFTGESVSTRDLGGSFAHSRLTGVCSVAVPDEIALTETINELLSFLPSTCDDLPPRWRCDDDADRQVPELDHIVPAEPTGGYDVRDIVKPVVDEGEFMELRPRWAPNLVTGLATLAGRPVGIVANQPISVAGTLDIAASHKGARFVSWCDAVNLPLVTLVDTPGFFPGKDLEWRGMIRHGAQLVFAYARATVPRLCVVLRKAYGGAYIVMDSKTMGNDLCLAWPSAEIAVMGAKGAVEILHRGADVDAKAAAEAEYESRYLSPFPAAERGYVDMVIEPADTRRELAAGLALLESKRERTVHRSHSNTPL